MAAILVLSFAACNSEIPEEEKNPPVSEKTENNESIVPENTETPESVEDLEIKEVPSGDYENAVKIVLTGNGATVDGKPADENSPVKVGGEIIYYHDIDNYESGNPYGEGEEKDKHSEEEAAAHTLVTITEPGEYFITGELKGQLAVDLGEEAETDPSAKVTLVFGGAEIECEIAPAVIFYNVYECADGKNTDEKVDTSEAGANVVSADGSVNIFRGGYVAKIYKDNAEEKKLHKYDGALYSKMTMNLDSGAEGTGTIGVAAENEGIGSEMHLSVNGGNILVESMDDGINTNEDEVSVTAINGGRIVIKGGLGTEGDGIDSNGWLVINGGNLYASGNGRSGDGGLDADLSVTVNGGTVVAFGGKNDTVNGESAQPFIQLSFAEIEEAGSMVSLVDESGTGIEAESDRYFQSVVLSSPELVREREYKLYLNEVMQEYTSNKDFFGIMRDEISGFTGENAFVPSFEYYMSQQAPPEGFDEWLSEEEDIPEDIRRWLENVSEHYRNVPGESPESGSGMNIPGKGAEGGFELESDDETDRTVFIINSEYHYYSGILDSSEATGKERVGFTVDGKSRMEDLFSGDLPGIKSIECTGDVPEKDIILTVYYSGMAADIDYSESCVLSDGFEKINGLFRDLEPGSYRLLISVSSENNDFSGSESFAFNVVD